MPSEERSEESYPKKKKKKRECGDVGKEGVSCQLHNGQEVSFQHLEVVAMKQMLIARCNGYRATTPLEFGAVLL